MDDLSVKTQMNSAILEELLKCGICHDMLYQPITILCQHTFCMTCINKNTQNICPLCKMAYIPSYKNNKNNILQEIIKTILPDDSAKREKEFIENTRIDAITNEFRRNIETAVYNNIIQEQINLRLEIMPSVAQTPIEQPPANPQLISNQITTQLKGYYFSAYLINKLIKMSFYYLLFHVIVFITPYMTTIVNENILQHIMFYFNIIDTILLCIFGSILFFEKYSIILTTLIFQNLFKINNFSTEQLNIFMTVQNTVNRLLTSLNLNNYPHEIIITPQA